MALTLSVSQLSGKLRVIAGNSNGSNVVIIDHIILSVYWENSSQHSYYYQDDFYFGSGRVSAGWTGVMIKENYSGGTAVARATADYWEVDEMVKSPTVDIS